RRVATDPRCAPFWSTLPIRSTLLRSKPARVAALALARRLLSSNARRHIMITTRFWGVRGSCATAGGHTAQVGGNTSCVEVRAGDQLFVLDAGTGLRALGAALEHKGQPIAATLLLSHFHWDHIQGFPFFGPAYAPSTRLQVYGPERAAPRGD